MLLLLTAPIGLFAAGTTWDTATEIAAGKSATGTLSKDVTNQWFIIEVTENGTAALKVTPNQGLNIQYLIIYFFNPADGNVYERVNTGADSYVNPGTSEKTLTVSNLAAGKYYIKVSRNSGEGSFTLAYSFTKVGVANDPEPNDTFNEAVEIKNGQTLTGHLGYLYSYNSNLSINDRDTQDWYKFTVTDDGQAAFTVTPQDGLNIQHMTLFFYNPADGNVYERTATGVDSYVNPNTSEKTLTVSNLAAGTYYLRLTHNAHHGGYKLKYVQTDNALKNDAESNNSFSEAVEIKNGQTLTGHLGYLYSYNNSLGINNRDTEDWYMFTVTNNGTAKLTVTPHDQLNLQYMTLYFYNPADGNVYERSATGVDSYVNPNTSEKTLTVSNLAAGTYYLRLTHNFNHGAYTLKYVQTDNALKNDTEPNDDFANAIYIGRGQALTGHLGYLYAYNNNLGINDRDTEDWYKFEVPRDGQAAFTVIPQDGLNLQFMTVYFYNPADGNVYQRSATGADSYVNPNTSEKTLTVSNLAPGTYYLRLTHNSYHGAYKLKYTYTQNPYATDEEPNDDFTRALTLEAGKTVAGHLGYLYGYSNNLNIDDRDTQDWYVINVDKKSTIDLTVAPQDNLNIQYMALYDYNPADGMVHELPGKYVSPGTTQKTLTVKDIDAGTYYLRVNRNSGHGHYFLAYASTIGTVPQQTPLPDETESSDDVTVTVGSNLVAGFSSSYNLDFTSLKSEGVSAWIATGFNDGNVQLSRVYQVPAGEGVYVKADKAGTYTIDKTQKEAFYVNMFVGVPDGTTVDMYENFWGETYLTLSLAVSKSTGKPGFFPNSGKKTYGKGKMYLHMPARLLPEYAKARINDFELGIEFEDVETTGINDASHLNDKGQMINDKHGEIYDLQGRKVNAQGTMHNAQLPKGLYIKNGRKVIIK